MSEQDSHAESALKTWILEQQNAFHQKIMEEIDRKLETLKKEMTGKLEDLQSRYETTYGDLDRRVSMLENKSSVNVGQLSVRSATMEPMSQIPGKAPQVSIPAVPPVDKVSSVRMKSATVTSYDTSDPSLIETLRNVTMKLNVSLGSLANVIDVSDLGDVHDVMKLCNSFSDEILKPVSDEIKLVRVRDFGRKIHDKLFPKVPAFVSRLEKRDTKVVAETLEKMKESGADVYIINDAMEAFEKKENVGKSLHKLRTKIPDAANYVAVIERELVIENFLSVLQSWKTEIGRVLLVRRSSGDIAKPPPPVAPPVVSSLLPHAVPKRSMSNPVDTLMCKGCHEALTKLSMVFEKEMSSMDNRINKMFGQLKTQLDSVERKMLN